jgi:sulfate permease, SulP family
VFTPQEIRTNVLGGLTVALAMVPEAVAFSLVAHVSPLTGLYAAFILALITSAFGGRPGMISGATGSLAVVMVALVATHGVEYLFATVVLMGVLQMLFAVAKLGKLIRLIPHPVMLGFVNGLAIVIFLAQFGHFKTTDATGVSHWLPVPALLTMFGLIALTLLVIYVLPRFTKAVPASLVGILVVSVLVEVLGIHTRTVGDLGSIGGGLPTFHLPGVPLNWRLCASSSPIP